MMILYHALINILSAKLRSFLAILGILVGTAAVVALISCGQLATEKALSQFKALGTDLLAVSVFQKGSGKITKNDTFSLQQWRELPDKIPAISKIAPYSTAYNSLSFAGNNLKGAIIGADERLADIMHIDLLAGNFVSFVDSYEHYCVIGDNVAAQMKALTQDPLLGQQIRIGNALYTVIGIAKPWVENNFLNDNINRAIIIPLASMAIISQDSSINNAMVLLHPTNSIDPIVKQITQIIESAAPKLSVFIRSPKQIIDSMDKQGRIFTLMLAIIGSISLLVGGIGIMNIMLVSVSERKKEIGLRKAVGARNKDIQRLFLMESVVLSLLGGGLGVILGLLLTYCVAWFSQWNFTVYWLPVIAGFLVSVTSGIFFGYYPAKRAAHLDPIISLRSE